MKRFSLALLFLLLIGSAHAQVGITYFPGPGMPAAAGGAYTGPGDVVAFGHWYGLRAYSAATRGTKSINVCDNANANCSDVLTDATTGKLNNPGTHGANNCNTSGTCVVPTVYDKVSTGDCTQATLANMATLNMIGGPGGNTPALVFVRASSQTYLCATTAVGDNQPNSQSAVTERTGTTGSFNTVISYGAQDDILFNAGANAAGEYAGNPLTATANDNAWHAIQALANGASSSINIDGTSTGPSNAGTNNPTANTKVGNGVGGFLDGRASEFGTIQGNQSASFSAVNSNQHTFWGF